MKKIITISALLATSCACATIQLDVSIDINGQTYKRVVKAQEGDTASFACGQYMVTLGAAPIETDEEEMAFIALSLRKDGQSDEKTPAGVLISNWNEKAEADLTEAQEENIHVAIIPSKQ